MYEVTGNESVIELAASPFPGLPSYPLLLAEEHRAVLAYRISEDCRNWQPEQPNNDLGGDGAPFAIIRVDGPYYTIWTPYSQEGIGRHPLAKAGLRWFAVFEVMHSPLIEPHPVIQYRHLVFQFEDSTLDIVCRGIELFRYCGSGEAVKQKVGELFRTFDV